MLSRPKSWLRPRRAVAAASLMAVTLLTAAAPAPRASGETATLIEIVNRNAEVKRSNRLGANLDNAYQWLALGLARLEEREPESAARAFVAAAVFAREPELAALAYYNLGVAALEQRDLETARDAFFDSLALAPGDSQTRFNLEWTLLGLEVRPPPSPPEPRPEEESGRSTSPADESPPETTEPDLVPATSDVAGPTPSEAERARLLDRVIDDPTRGFRSGRDRNKYRRPSGLAW